MTDKIKIENFADRHIGPQSNEINEMLKKTGVNSLDELIEETIPRSIKLKTSLKLNKPLTESEFIEKLRTIAEKNKIYKSYIGLGYHPVITPTVILRNILENPGWYTQYTPYQAEISQGRMEALMNFQTMIVDLTGLPVANASLLDEGTAAAEAMSMFFSYSRTKKKNARKFFISENCFPQTIDVILSRANPLGIEVEIGNHEKVELNDEYFAVLVQYPDSNGEIFNYKNFFESAHKKNIYTIVSADIYSLILLASPSDFGADVVVGSTQRFGVPMGYGGPHAAYFATRDEFKRHIPGRIIGLSIDKFGNPAYRMALQTREQHIKREKATSNICTAQVLLAIIAGMYAVYHGPERLKNIALRIHSNAKVLDYFLSKMNYKQNNKIYFDTLKIVFDEKSKDKIANIRKSAESKKINFRYEKDSIGISVNETTKVEDLCEIINIFGGNESHESVMNLFDKNYNTEDFDSSIIRKKSILCAEVFNSYHSETEMLRYLKKLENKDLSLTLSMIPLGSCTMKLNATTEMLGITMSEFCDLHPFCPKEQAEGYSEMIEILSKDLCEITGFDAVSLQPNSGAQGEFTGLMVIREYHKQRGESNRNIVLIPSSAHGTNPASAIMAGMKVIVVNCDNNGNIDTEDLNKKAELYKNDLCALMVTYPSTHGVFESNILEICEIIHSYGGQVYMDGANMNAQVGLTSPAKIGADVCHLNLHKTFAIPHGGGGPGVGPILVAKHLADYLPGNVYVKTGGKKAINGVASAPYGSAGVLVISFAYISMMGEEGLSKATKVAILNANYLKSKLEKYYKVLYSGDKGRVAHELIFDLREFKTTAKIEAEDIAKRLMDYGFHAPTVSFPVPGTFMVEPTESESKYELDRFCEAMIKIREEIKEIEEGKSDIEDNLLKNAPFTAYEISGDEWKHKFSRRSAAYPVSDLKNFKFWPSVARINNAFGDRNLICSCGNIEDFIESIKNLK